MDLPELLVTRLRPRIGWGRMMMGLLAVLCLPFAASASTLELPTGAFFWAGFGGYLLGLWSARDVPLPQRWRLAVRVLAWLLVGALGAALLALSIDAALPPLGLVLQDVGAFGDWLVRAVRAGSVNVPLALIRSWVFMAEALTRFGRDVAGAPDGGRAGARLMVALGGVVLTWVGSLLLGFRIGRGRLFFWSLPVLLVLALTTIFGGSMGGPLVIGLALLLGVIVGGEMRWREMLWLRSGTDYSEELRFDVLLGGGLTIIVALLIALVLPTSLDNVLAALLWGNVDPPSGVAVLEQQARPISQAPQVPIGISRLPVLQLGLSLEQGPPETPALRVQVSSPLPESPFPHYWRARLFNIYTNRGWTTDARVRPEGALNFTTVLTGTLAQTVEDLRANHEILIALANPIAVDIPTNAERLADGTLAALTTDSPVARYRVLSSLTEYATLPPPTEQLDLSPFTGLPALPPRVPELARAITNSATTPYEQGLAIESYLRELPYTYQVEALPQTGDAVDYFLFDTRRGYCTYYASAMAVLARSLNIPARVATGYFTGDYDAATRTYTLYERDAHAWPELYIDGRWIPFEPTPIRPAPARATASAPPTPLLAPAPEPAPANITGPLIWAGVLLGIIVVVAAAWLIGRWRKPQPLIVDIQRQLEQLGARRGVVWPRGATLHEYGALLAPQLSVSAATALGELIAIIGRARYGGRTLDPADERALRESWQSLRQEQGGKR